jgi:hypothetical protein
MPQPIELAKDARSTLARALEALQSSPDVPETLLEMAAPIAKTMGLLHRIERSGGSDLGGVPEALDHVRSALDRLQAASADHPAADDAMEHVAASLSKLFALAKAHKAAGAPPAAAPKAKTGSDPRGTTERTQPSIQDSAPPQAGLQASVQVQASPEPQFTPRGTVRMARPADDARAPQKTTNLAQEPPAQQPPLAHGHAAQTLPVDERPAFPDPARARPAAPALDVKADYREPQPGARPATGRLIEVELGAHSTSNFYKGLSGNDVFDHGGIFVQTYTVPKIGEAVSLRIHLPGDLELDAGGQVQWIRETRSGESEPGFGARITHITDEGRQLVYRYVRNREPMFYDDL